MRKIYFAFLLIASAATAQPGALCSDPIVIESLPYTSANNTANFPDSYDPQTETHPECATTDYGNYYHGGNDVIYSFTAVSSGTVKFEIPSAPGWTGMFVYNSCDDIGIIYAACATGVGAGARTIDNFAVTAGQTYFIFISSWPAPQTVAFTLNVMQLTLAVDTRDLENQIVLYPNPVSDRLLIKTSLELTGVSVINANGQYLNVSMAGDEIDVKQLQSGFYIAELKTADGIAVRKPFIKQ